VYGKSEGKIYIDKKTGLQAMLRNVSFMIYSKFKLQLKFGMNKNYSSTVVNFHTGFRQGTH